jgi:hypothetical protein
MAGITFCRTTVLDVAISALMVKSIFQTRHGPINTVALPTASGLNPHMVTVIAIINGRLMLFMMKNYFPLLILHCDDCRSLCSKG